MANKTGNRWGADVSLDEQADGTYAERKSMAGMGEVQASPTQYTLLDRLKAIATALAGNLKTQDAGSTWTAVHTIFHGDAHTVQNVSGAPTGGQKLVATDIVISTAAACEVTIQEETSNTVIHGPFLMAANGFLQLTTRSRLSKLPAADKHYQVISTTADHITVETWTYSEA